jgi:hypothetical protein
MVSLVQVCFFLTIGIAWTTGQQTSKNSFFFVSAKGKELWAIDRQYIVNRYVNGQWVQLTEGLPAGTKVFSVGASPDGWAWITAEDGAAWRWNLDLAKWDLLGGNDNKQVNVINKVSGLLLKHSGAFYESASSNGMTITAWNLVTGVPLAKWVSIGENGERWLIDMKGLVFRRNNTTKKYEPFSGNNAVNLDVQDSDRVVMTTQCCWVYLLNGDKWARQDIPGCTKQATITHDNVYYLDELDSFGAATVIERVE